MDISATSAEVHPEDRDLISRLATLQDMHDQVLDLRTLLPQRLWNPILATIKAPARSQPTRSPSGLFQQLQKTADDGCREIETFKDAWHSTEMQNLLVQTKTEHFPQGTDTWKVNYRNQIKDLKEKETGLLAAAEQSITAREEPKEVVDTFRSKNPKLKLDLPGADTLWPVTLTVAGMSFEIDEKAANDAKTYDVIAKPGRRISNVQQEILKFVQHRKVQDSLGYLLDLLGSYDGVTTRDCDRCHKIIDDSLHFAIVRESKRLAGSEEQADTQWMAYHQKCA